MPASGSRVRVFIDGESADLVSEIRTAERAIGRFGSTTARQSTSMARAGKTTDTFHKKTSALGGAFKGAALAAGGAVAAYIGIAQVKDAISTTTDLAKTTLGLAGNLDLTTKAASEWAAVAKARGVEGKQLSQSFGTLAKNIEAAKVATSGQADMFRKLGVTQGELKRQSFNETLFSVADGMREMGAGSERTATSMKLFGKGWQAVTPLIREGSSSMQEQLDLANQYGATFSGGSIKSIKDLIQAERELELAQLGLKVQFTKEIAPSLIKVFLGIAKLVSGFRKAKGDITNFVSGIVGSLKEFWESAGLLRSIVKNVVNTIVGVFKGLWQTIKGVVKLISGVLTGDFGRVWDGVKDIFKGGIKIIGSLFKGSISLFKDVAGRVGDGIAGAFSFAWDKIKGIFRGGANIAIDVINGIIKAINFIPGIPDIGLIGHIGGGGEEGGGPASTGKHKAGKIADAKDKAQGYYAGGKIAAPTAIVGEESPRHPEYVLATNPAYRPRNVQLWAQAGHELGIPGFALGGLLGGLGNVVGNVVQSLGQSIGVGTPISAANIISKLPDPHIPAPFTGLGPWLIERAKDFIRDKVVSPVTSVAGAIKGGMTTGGGATYSIANRVASMFGLTVGSGYRSPAHNAAVGGVPNSLHTHGTPANPGAIDLNGPVPSLYEASSWSSAHLKLAENLVHDVGSGLHFHMGFFKKGGVIGDFTSSAYGPPWGGINGTGVTATGVNLSAGQKRHIIAVDPSVVPLGSEVYAWPNPFNHKGPFQAEDTGGAIQGNRIDFYDWMGRSHQMNWGMRGVKLWKWLPGGRGHGGGGKAGGGHGGGGGHPSLGVAGPGGGGGTGFLPNFGKIRRLGLGGHEGRALGLVNRSLHQKGLSGENRDVLLAIRELLATFVANQKAILNAKRRERTAINAAVASAASGQIGGTVNLSRQTPVAGSFASY